MSNNSINPFFAKSIRACWSANFIQKPHLLIAIRVDENISSMYEKMMTMNMVKANGKKDGYVYPSIAYLQSMMHLSEPTIKKYIRILKDYGWLQTDTHRGQGRPSCYYFSYPHFVNFQQLICNYDLLTYPAITKQHISFADDVEWQFDILFKIILDIRKIYKEELFALSAYKHSIKSSISVDEIKNLKQKYLKLIVDQVYTTINNKNMQSTQKIGNQLRIVSNP